MMNMRLANKRSGRMLNWKALLLSLSSFTLIGCGSQTDEIVSDRSDEIQVTEAEESKVESVTVENIDDDQTFEEEEVTETSQDIDTAEAVLSAAEADPVEINQEDSPSEADVAPEVTEETSPREPQDGKDLNMVEAVAAADSALPEDTQFLIESLSDTVYQIEARQNSGDSSVSNLLGLYQYDMETGEIMKQDPLTGEFTPL